jgi:hypothetical protein
MAAPTRDPIAGDLFHSRDDDTLMPVGNAPRNIAPAQSPATTNTDEASVITRPALGHDIQLGMLWDARTGEVFGGISLWKDSDANAAQEIEEGKVQGAAYAYSLSLDEARKNSGLDAEGSLSLDLGIIEAKGTAKYLSHKQTSTFEARVDVSCTIVRRTRRIPMEKLVNMPYEAQLSNPRYTHFVGEVVEGGSATLSFVQSCSSAEEARAVTGKLAARLKSIPVSGSVELNWTEEDRAAFECTKISYSGAMAENVVNFADAMRVAREMPTKLMQQMNTLSYKLLPLSLLDNTARRAVRNLDATLVSSATAALNAGATARLQLDEILDQVLLTTFPVIKRQATSFATAFAACQTRFTQEMRTLLPRLKDGTTDDVSGVQQLRRVVADFELQTRVANEYVAKKRNEANVLSATVAALLADGFENHLDASALVASLDSVGPPRLILSLGGSSIDIVEHPMQRRLDPNLGSGVRTNSNGSEDDDDDELEWFEAQPTVSSVMSSCSALRQLRARQNRAFPATFAVASIDRAYAPGEPPKRRKTQIGDIVLDHAGKLLLVSGELPSALGAPSLQVKDQTITVSWAPPQNPVISVTGFVARYRPRPNERLDGILSHAAENEPFKELQLAANTSTASLGDLRDNTDYEVSVCVETIVGRSEWSPSAIGRTAKLPSEASQLITFFSTNRDALTYASDKRWELTTEAKPTLFLGNTVVAERTCASGPFQGELAMRIVDVAPQYKPQIKAADVRDPDNTKVLVFVGTTGHGKTTQINSFVSFLLGSDLQDAARILIVDDRGMNQANSVTQFVTCYRLRPLSPLFDGKTLLIVDTPGYGDTEGVQRDRFVTAAMSEFFNAIQHVNAIVFTCKANETRTTILSPVSTYVFSLFAKNVRSCLRTIYTFSDVGTPQARKVLQQLEWPVEYGEVEVHNAAFTVESPDSANEPKMRDWWRMSMNGQQRVLQMLLRMEPVPTEPSAQVTTDRLALERKCELAEKKILRTANDAQQLLANLGALADAVGAAPGDKVEVTVTDVKEVPVPAGKATTLCTSCNHTCHEICGLGDDNAKMQCVAMSGEYCTICPGRCHWTKHKNARFILRPESRKEMVIPEDLIKRWNSNNNSLEGALLDAIARYLELQRELCHDIEDLAALTEKLKNTALRHNPEALLNYVETLIQTARARGAPAEQLVQLTTAKNTLVLAAQIREHGAQGATRDSTVLQDVLGAVQWEMRRRRDLQHHARAKEEKKSCDLYNRLLDSLPRELKDKAPAPLKEAGLLSQGALYPDNLKAVVKLVQLVLTDGGVVAALATA